MIFNKEFMVDIVIFLRLANVVAQPYHAINNLKNEC